MLDSKSLVGSIKDGLFEQLSNSISARFDLGENSAMQQWKTQALLSLSNAMKRRGIHPLTFPAGVSISALISQGFSIAQILKLGGSQSQTKPVEPVKTEAISEEVSEPVKHEETIPEPEKGGTAQARATVSAGRRPRYADGTLIAGARPDIDSEQYQADLLNEAMLELSE